MAIVWRLRNLFLEALWPSVELTLALALKCHIMPPFLDRKKSSTVHLMKTPIIHTFWPPQLALKSAEDEKSSVATLKKKDTQGRLWLKGEASAFSPGHDLMVLGSSPALGSLLHGEPASPSTLLLFPLVFYLSLSLSQINWKKVKKEGKHPETTDPRSTGAPGIEVRLLPGAGGRDWARTWGYKDRSAQAFP